MYHVEALLNPGSGFFFSCGVGYSTSHGCVSWGLLEVCRKVAGQGDRLLIDRKEIGIWSRQTIFVNQHLMLPFGLDVIAHLRRQFEPRNVFR